MLVRVVCAAALALSSATPAFAAGAMPAPSAAASAHCPEMQLVHVESLPASAWAPVSYPSDAETILQARVTMGGATHGSGLSIHVFRKDADGVVVSAIAEKSGKGWTVYAAEKSGDTISARTASLRDGRALERILNDACFWAEPTDVSSAPADASCVDGMEIHLEAIVPQGRRSAVQHCSPVGLTGEVAGMLWSAAAMD